MGNSVEKSTCNETEISQIYNLTKDLGVFPPASLDNSFTGYLCLNSSTLLSSHYADVQRSLTLEQQTTFNHSLRSTFGESGKVTMGGVGVVALALSLLFDVLAQQAKNQNGTSDPIQRVFTRQGKGGNVSETGTIIGDYLKLVPRIANDPQRMKEETERYEEQLNTAMWRYSLSVDDDGLYTFFSDYRQYLHAVLFHHHMSIHLFRLGKPTLDNSWFWRILNLKSNDHEKDIGQPDTPRTFFEYIQTISPQNHHLFEKCKKEIDFKLPGRYFRELYRHILGCIRGDPKYYKRLISQRDDFYFS